MWASDIKFDANVQVGAMCTIMESKRVDGTSQSSGMDSKWSFHVSPL